MHLVDFDHKSRSNFFLAPPVDIHFSREFESELFGISLLLSGSGEVGLLVAAMLFVI